MGNLHRQSNRCGFGTFLRHAPCAVLCCGVTQNTLAQSGILEEITVTAQKREQSIQDVGITITAFSGEQIRELGFEDSFDVARMTPGVHISGNNGGQKTLFTIRGVTQNDFNDQTEAPVAVYVDEGYVGFGQGQVFGLFDLNRVEILKGPQGTLFGRNATGGLVHYVTRQPTETVEGCAGVLCGSHDQVRLEGAIAAASTGPGRYLFDSLAVEADGTVCVAAPGSVTAVRWRAGRETEDAGPMSKVAGVRDRAKPLISPSLAPHTQRLPEVTP